MKTVLLAVCAAMLLVVTMATTFDVLLDTARLLESLREGAASAAGTTTTLVDTTLSAAEGHADDEWNGGSLFLKTDASSQATQVIDTLSAEQSASGTLTYRPATAGTVTISTPTLGSVTDDGLGAFSTGYVAVYHDTMTGSSGTLTHGHIIPNLMVIVNSISQVIGGDDGNGNLFLSVDSSIVGSIDYVTGDWTYTGVDPLSESNYSYEAISGSINYTTGVIALAFSAAQTGSVTATYTYSATLFRQYIPVVADFAVSGGTVTFTPAAAVPTGTGDTYGLMTRRYPRWLLFQKLNEALREIKQYVLDQTDIPTANLVNNEYALADSVRVFAVWNGNTGQTPRDWQRVTRYQQVNGRLQFYDWLIGDTVRVQYYGDTTPVDDEQDVIPVTIDPMWLAYEAAVKCARWRLFQPGADEKTQTTLVNDLMARRDKQKARANIINPNPSSFKTAILPER